MITKYTTGKLLELMLEAHLRRAGFKDATAAEGTRYVSEEGVPCLRVSLFKWPQAAMSWGELKSYARALAELPGVVRTEIVHDGQGINLRDQVIVIHKRMWED